MPYISPLYRGPFRLQVYKFGLQSRLVVFVSYCDPRTVIRFACRCTNLACTAAWRRCCQHTAG